VDPAPDDDVFDTSKAVLSVGSAIVQIILLDIVFSIDSILTAVGHDEHLPIMIAAVLFAVGVMLVAADPLANFIAKNPTVVMLALGFLLMIGAVLIADGIGIHVPKGYILRRNGLLGPGRESQHVGARSRARKEAARAAAPDRGH
jgi:predicted tellurium resistance membrane protein TerC